MRTKSIDYPVHQIRTWIDEGKTQQWVGEQVGLTGRLAGKLISKMCKKHGIKCQRTGPRAGKGHPNWKGGLLTDKRGYVYQYVENHPFARKPRKKYVFQHRLVMEKHLGRYLDPKEVVHHKNGDHSDNRIENLSLYQSNGNHLADELKGRCPNWSAEGLHRIRQGKSKYHGIRVESKPCDLKTQ